MYKDHQRSKARESTVRKTQQQKSGHHPHLPLGRRLCRLIFQSMSVAPASDDSSSTDSFSPAPSDDTDTDDSNAAGEHAERPLPNGDFYTGQWHFYLPHGVGKYLWTDGCMYEGQWRHGKTMGRGKFSWPSGATYEGDFKAGFMDGTGTYTGSNGDTYKGGWSMNLRHGPGKKRYANGDSYDGHWHSGLQDGHGRYIWANGNEYNGEWRSGVIHGRGSLIWANGNRYDGGWEDGVPVGNGSFRWGDGSLYIGIWSKDGGGEAEKGIYYPSPAATSPTARDPQAIFDRELPGCTICPGEMVTILPSQKRLNLSGIDNAVDLVRRSAPGKGPDAPRPRPRRRSVDNGGGRGGGSQGRKPTGRSQTSIGGITNGSNGGSGERGGFDRICIWESDGDITCDIVDGNSVISGRGSTDSSAASSGGLRQDEDVPRMSRTLPNQPIRLPKTMKKKQGETISKGHKNYDLMLNLQLGIRHAVGRQAAQAATLDLKSSAFDPREKLWTKFPPEGSKYTPPHQSCDFKWKDYCPLVFRTLRRLFKVDAADYMLSICGNDALRELSSPGKSGSFFYLTDDDGYMIKTIKKAEVKVLLRMLPSYFKHVRSYENTLVAKFFGLHCVKLTGTAQKKVRFVIMGNLFCSEYVIHRRFDLKGSSHGRTTDKPESEIDENTTLKDLDLDYIFRLHKSWFQEFIRQVDRDCELLEQERIMDYSLLVGLHFREPRETVPCEGNVDIENFKEAAPRLSKADMDQLLEDPTRWPSFKLGKNMPARVEMTVRRHEGELIGEPTGEIYDVVLFFGIIDILQDYDISKKLEHAYKSFQYDPTSISAVDPKQYSKRFKDFIYKAFAEDTRRLHPA